MEFTYAGEKYGNVFKLGNLLFLFISVLLLILFFIYSDWETISEYSVVVVILFIFSGAYFINLFLQKSRFLQKNIKLSEDYIEVDRCFNIDIRNCKLLILYERNSFSRYILYDTEANLSIYSNNEDEFYHKIKRKLKPVKLNLTSFSIYNNEILLGIDANDKIIYNLESGSIDIQITNIEEKLLSPSYFYIDPKFQ